jgi:hypothetical protein
VKITFLALNAVKANQHVVTHLAVAMVGPPRLSAGDHA